MQTIDIANNELATTTNSATPHSPTPQQSNAAKPGIDPDLLQIIDNIVAEIRKCASGAFAWRIAMGINLRQYRDSLNDDDWHQVLNSGRLPFSSRKAQMLLRIGDHKIFGDLKQLHLLPNSITILNELAALALPVIEQALAEGTIHPGTTLAEAKKLVAEHRARKPLKRNPLSCLKPI